MGEQRGRGGREEARGQITQGLAQHCEDADFPRDEMGATGWGSLGRGGS